MDSRLNICLWVATGTRAGGLNPKASPLCLVLHILSAFSLWLDWLISLVFSCLAGNLWWGWMTFYTFEGDFSNFRLNWRELNLFYHEIEGSYLPQIHMWNWKHSWPELAFRLFLPAAVRTFGMPCLQAREVSEDDSGEEASTVPSRCVQWSGST